MDTKLEVTNLITPLIKTFRAIGAEWDNFFKKGLSNYLQSQTSKYYHTNTFLHRGEKIRFNSIYYPIKARHKALITDFEDLNSVFEEYKYITLIGSAGSGKTTLLKFIFLSSLLKPKKIPILIELRNLNDYNGNFEDLITEKIFKNKIKPSEGIFNRALESGNFIFLFDGYDEIFSAKKQDINRQIEQFVDSYSNNYFLITTRPGSGIENSQRFYDFKVEELNDGDVNGFINIMVNDNERKARIFDVIKDAKNASYKSYLRNPLLLSMFILSFESHPEIPSRKSAFYRNVFDTLYSMHDGVTKNSFVRERITKLQRDDFEEVLSLFSFLSLHEGKFSFTHEYLSDKLTHVKKITKKAYSTEHLVSDLVTSISILTKDGFEYKFPHRSLQEYFTAIFISKLPTEKKAKAYSKLLYRLGNTANDSSLNFWTLCYELDSQEFIKRFVLPQLKQIVDDLDISSDESLMLSFLELSNSELVFPSPDRDQLYIDEERNFFSNLCYFVGVRDFMDSSFFNFPRLSGVDFKIIPYLKRNKHTGIYTNIKNDKKIIEFLIKYRFTNVIFKLRDSIIEKIEQLQKELKDQDETIDNILE